MTGLAAYVALVLPALLCGHAGEDFPTLARRRAWRAKPQKPAQGPRPPNWANTPTPRQ